MKIRYLIDGSSSDYVEIHIDQVSKKAEISLVEADLVVQHNETPIGEVLSREPSINPQVHIAKKGRIWDVHVWKIDSYGQEYRNTLGMLTEKDLNATDIVFINDDATDITMKNYTTQPLEVYNSVLTVNHYKFNEVGILTGTSGNGRSEVVVNNGKLELGFGSQVFVPMMTGDGMNLSDFPFSLYIELAQVGDNSNTKSPSFVFKLGSNVFTFDYHAGVKFSNGTVEEYLLAPSTFNGGGAVTIALHVGHETVLSVNGNRVPLPNFIKNEVVNSMELSSFCNTDTATLVEHIITHAAIPFRLDSKPPGIVMGLVVEPGYKEVLLRWDENKDKDLKGYNVYVNGVKHNKTIITENSYRVMNLENDVLYSFSVTAVDTANNESPTFNRVDAKPSDMYDKQPPQPPQNVQAVAGNRTINIAWTPNTESDLNGYNVYLNGVKYNTELLKMPNVHIEHVENYQEYKITVTAVDTKGNESGPSETIAVIPTDNKAPKEVTNLSETHTTTTVSLSWVNPMDADFSHVNIYRNGLFIGISTNGMYDDSKLSPGTYTYILRTEDKDGNESFGREITVTLQ